MSHGLHSCLHTKCSHCHLSQPLHSIHKNTGTQTKTKSKCKSLDISVFQRNSLFEELTFLSTRFQGIKITFVSKFKFQKFFRSFKVQNVKHTLSFISNSFTTKSRTIAGLWVSNIAGARSAISPRDVSVVNRRGQSYLNELTRFCKGFKTLCID